MEKEDEKPRSKTKKNVKIIQKLWYFFDLNGLSKSTIFFKINLYKVVPKCKALGRSTLPSHYFKSNIRLM